MDPDDLADHVVGTYFALRAAMSALAIGLPIALLIASAVDPDLNVLGSMSSYYYSPMRNVFVGAIVATGVALICYRGFGKLENRLLNAAGTLVIVVALCPTNPPDDSSIGARMLVHIVSAVAFFLAFAASVWFCADDTLHAADSDPNRIRRYHIAFRVIAIVLVAAPALAVVLLFAIGQGAIALFAVEAIAVIAFGVYWAVKSYELRGTDLERPDRTKESHHVRNT